MDLATVSASKYVSLTTFKRDGTPGATPVWIVDLGDATVGFTTGAESLKVKRIRNDSRVRLQPCNARGNVVEGTEPVEGIAEVVEGPGFEAVRAAVKAKYGIQYSAMLALAKVGRLFGKGEAADCAIVIRPAPAAEPS